MQQAWKMTLWALAASLAAAAVILFLVFRFVLPPQETAGRAAPYTIRAWEGQVAVFQGDQPFPMQVFDSFVEALPEELRQKVLKGIPVEDEAQLSLLLEDYTS
ncbi:MAG: hypothetical protein IJ518_02475 [Clostridia bacterium]|nr:hypothetical protein [Clostridia bacterium]